MKPTPEQLEAVAKALGYIDGSWALYDVVEAVWDEIAPLVLEAAAVVAEKTVYFDPERTEGDLIAARIRALK